MDVIALGEILIDLIALQRDIPLSETSSFSWAAGGAPANVAVGVVEAGLLCRIYRKSR